MTQWDRTMLANGEVCTVYLSNGLKVSGQILLPFYFPWFSPFIKLISKKSVIYVSTNEIISIQYYND